VVGKQLKGRGHGCLVRLHGYNPIPARSDLLAKFDHEPGPPLIGIITFNLLLQGCSLSCWLMLLETLK
jgi:hypothetical protein